VTTKKPSGTPTSISHHSKHRGYKVSSKVEQSWSRKPVTTTKPGFGHVSSKGKPTWSRKPVTTTKPGYGHVSSKGKPTWSRKSSWSRKPVTTTKSEYGKNSASKMPTGTPVPSSARGYGKEPTGTPVPSSAKGYGKKQPKPTGSKSFHLYALVNYLKSFVKIAPVPRNKVNPKLRAKIKRIQFKIKKISEVIAKLENKLKPGYKDEKNSNPFLVLEKGC
jgi:hypothetical protein